MIKSSNINILWAQLIVEELIRCGVDYFCLAPGSRSAPLAIAVARHAAAKAMVHYDERGLGFHALGHVAATKRPGVVITTSGTAAANLFPSIIEASKKKLPLMILTADRPPELRATGANQTIDQNKLFGDYVRFYFDFPCPTIEIAAEMVLTTIDQAVFRAKGELPGPVHLNCMFREPLALVATPLATTKQFSQYLSTINSWLKVKTPFTTYTKAKFFLAPEEIADIVQILKGIKNGIIAVGKTAGQKDSKAILELAQKLGWAIFPDITSGLRLGQNDERLISYFDQILLAETPLAIDGVLHLGGRMTSQRWYQLIKKIPPEHYLMVLNHPLRNDPGHRVTQRLQSSIKDFCEMVSAKIAVKRKTQLLFKLQKANTVCEKIIIKTILPPHGPAGGGQAKLTEPAVARLISQLLPKNSGLFVGNSMPIRDLDMFSDSKGEKVRMTANRGASGIDGNIATAAGFAAGLKAPCTAVIGDLAFLHDVNSLAMLKTLPYPFILIVLNNNGGGVFSFLPIGDFKDDFEKFFGTPHNLTFKQMTEGFGISYSLIRNQTEFKQTYQKALKLKKAVVLEVQSSRKANFTLHKRIQNKLRAAL